MGIKRSNLRGGGEGRFFSIKNNVKLQLLNQCDTET